MIEKTLKTAVVALSSFALFACSTAGLQQSADPSAVAGVASYPEKLDEFGNRVAIGPGQRVGGKELPFQQDGQFYSARGLGEVSLSELERQRRPDWVTELSGPVGKRSHAPGPIPEEKMAELRRRAMELPANARIPQTQEVQAGELAAGVPSSVSGFAALDAGDCCGGTTVSVPPDPEMAAGLNHVVVAVNSAFAVYGKSGNLADGPFTFESLFNDSNCNSTFDPNVLYDMEYDRYFMGIVGNGAGSHYCMAVSANGDPTGTWYRFTLQVDAGGNFFDYPHAGIGREAIYVGANMFASSFEESRIWAIDKVAMYGNAAPQSRSFSVNEDFTPQPMTVHAATAPAGPHYFISNDVASDLTWNGDDFIVREWSNPFSGGAPAVVGTFNLVAASGLVGGFPVDQPQSGSRRTAILDGGDWRIQDAEYHDGSIFMTQAISCNPGGGTVNCVRWAEVDPTGPSVLDADIIASSGEFRSYPDGAANSCGDFAVGYTKTSTSMFPSVFTAARENGLVGSELELKAGETSYSSFQNWRQANRWGDYTGMTIDPDGETFWYMGEYAGAIGLSTNWATWVSSFKLDSCGGGGGNNQLPVAVDDDFSLDVNVAASVSGNVLANDDEGDAPATVAFGSPSSGSLSNTSAAGDFTYTPDGGFTGEDTFSYTLTDSNNDASSAIVTVTVSDSGGGGGDGLVITSAVGTKTRGVKIVDLAWTGTDGQGSVSISRDGSALVTTQDDGAYRDNTGEKGGGTYVYEICETDTSNCDSVTVPF